MWLDPNFLSDIQKREKRVACLVPSLTELLVDGGIGSLLVARTRFCIHPHGQISNIPMVGGTKNIKIDLLQSLKPDIVIANKEENTKQDIEAILSFSPVYVSDIKTIEDIVLCLKDLKKVIPELKNENISDGLINLGLQNIFHNQRIAYLIWNDPIMTVGGDTFIHHILTKAGFSNVFKSTLRYPVISMNDLIEKKLDYLFLSSEPFPFSQKHIQIFQNHLPHVKIILVDGEMFSWYGSRILKSVQYLKSLKNEIEERY